MLLDWIEFAEQIAAPDGNAKKASFGKGGAPVRTLGRRIVFRAAKCAKQTRFADLIYFVCSLREHNPQSAFG